MTATLNAGHAVYPCGAAVKGFKPVMFPPPGGRATCSSNPAACRSGWIPQTAAIDLAG